MKLTPEDQSKLRDKELANIIRKLNGGKTLTAREQAKLDAAAAGEGIDATGYVGTWDELATRLTVTRRAIQDWRIDPRYKGEIEARRDRLSRADGRHCVAEWLRLMIDLGLKRGAAAAEATDDPENAGEEGDGTILRPPRVGGRKSEWDLAIAALDHRKKENAVLTHEGTLLVAADLEVPLGATFAVIQTKLAQFPARVARYLRGLTEIGEIEDRLRDEIDADLGDIHGVRYTADGAIAEAVAAVPFDEETKALCEKLLFAGSDRTALLELACAIATQALRLIGQRALRDPRSPAEPVPHEAQPRDDQPSGPEQHEQQSGGDTLVPETVAHAPEPARKKRRKKATIATAKGPPEVEAMIVEAPRRKATRRRRR